VDEFRSETVSERLGALEQSGHRGENISPAMISSAASQRD
jgi:hypothetical protein